MSEFCTEKTKLIRMNLILNHVLGKDNDDCF